MSKKQGLFCVLIMISAIVLISYNRNNDQDYKDKQPDIAENNPMAEYADSQCIESHNTIDINAVQSLLELGNKAVKDPGYHYYVQKCWNLGNICRVYGIDGVDAQKYFVPALQIEIPDDRKRKNELIKYYWSDMLQYCRMTQMRNGGNSRKYALHIVLRGICVSAIFQAQHCQRDIATRICTSH